MVSKKTVLPVIAVAIIGLSAFGVSRVSAQTTSTKPYSGLVAAIAQKFGLDQNQVQTVADQYWQQQQTNREQQEQQNLETKLNQAVTDGKINATQKQAILDEIKALKAKYSVDSLKNMTAQERQQTLKNEKTDLENWAKQQGIDLNNLFPLLGRGMGFRGYGMGMHRGNWDNPGTSASPSPRS